MATLVAVVQTRATVTGSPTHWRMTRYWGQLYVINYAVGIVTGLVMELQLGLNWSGLGHFSGNVFGSLLGDGDAHRVLPGVDVPRLVDLRVGPDEPVAAPGPGLGHRADRLRLGVLDHAVQNGFLQNPVGARVVGGVLRLTDASAVLTNPSALVALGHLMGGALLTGGLVFAGVSAWHLAARRPCRRGRSTPPP